MSSRIAFNNSKFLMNIFSCLLTALILTNSSEKKNLLLNVMYFRFRTLKIWIKGTVDTNFFSPQISKKRHFFLKQANINTSCTWQG